MIIGMLAAMAIPRMSRGSAAASGHNWHLMGSSESIFGLDNYINSDLGTRNIFDAARSYANGKPVVVYETNTNPPNAAGRPPDRA